MAVVYFYPKDGTPGCTKQACAFRDAFDKLAQAGVVVFGVSRDSAESHRKFRKEHNLPFPWWPTDGRCRPGLRRSQQVPGSFLPGHYLVDGNGKIVRVWPDVDPAVDAQRVLEAAGRLQAGHAAMTPGAHTRSA